MAGESWRLLLFGASGAIGQAIAQHALARGWTVLGVTRSAVPPVDSAGMSWMRYDPLTDATFPGVGDDRFDAVCWAQGANMADSLNAFDADRHLELYRANCLSVLAGAAALVAGQRLRVGGARLVIISSIWQERARQDKLSYAVTKAAIGGVVRSASVDLGADGHLINGVLPGVMDTPMTAANLSLEQLQIVRDRTTLGRLPDLATLSDLVLFLCSSGNNSITGQSVAVDLGMSNANLL